MQKLRLVFWWLVSLGALGSALMCFMVVQSKPWLSYLYVASALALVAGLIANPLVRPRIGLGTRPIITLAMLVALTIGGLWTLLLVTDQAMMHGGTLDTPERRQAIMTFNDGVELQSQGDYAGAADLYEQACTKDVAEGCYNHGILNELGQYGINQLEVARASYRKACDLHYAGACTNLGVMMDRGEGGPVDRDAAFELYVRACEGGDAKGCENQRITASAPAAD